MISCSISTWVRPTTGIDAGERHIDHALAVDDLLGKADRAARCRVRSHSPHWPVAPDAEQRRRRRLPDADLERVAGADGAAAAHRSCGSFSVSENSRTSRCQQLPGDRLGDRDDLHRGRAWQVDLRGARDLAAARAGGRNLGAAGDQRRREHGQQAEPRCRKTTHCRADNLKRFDLQPLLLQFVRRGNIRRIFRTARQRAPPRHGPRLHGKSGSAKLASIARHRCFERRRRSRLDASTVAIPERHAGAWQRLRSPEGG